MQPLVTIGIPTRNRIDYLRRAIESILAQTYRNIEIVVSDNASTDSTQESLESITDPRLRLLRREVNIGMLGNFNASLDAARGEFFLLLSDDDLLAPEAVERLVEPFVAPPARLTSDAIGMTWCPCEIIDANDQVLWITSDGPTVESSSAFVAALFSGDRGPRLASVLARTADVRSVGGYSSRYGDLCDTGNWGRAALHYPYVVSFPKPLVRYRMHAKALTASKSIGTDEKPTGFAHAADESVAVKCAIWQQWGTNLLEDCIAVLQRRGDVAGIKALQSVKSKLLANLTVDVLMRGKNRGSWIGTFAAEFWRSRRFMMTPYVAKRIVRDGWKLLRLK